MTCPARPESCLTAGAVVQFMHVRHTRIPAVPRPADAGGGRCRGGVDHRRRERQVLHRAGQPVLSTDSRYAGTAERDCPDVELLIERNVEAELVRRALAGGLHAIGFEDFEMTVRRYHSLASIDNSVVLVPLGTGIDELRVVKD